MSPLCKLPQLVSRYKPLHSSFYKAFNTRIAHFILLKHQKEWSFLKCIYVTVNTSVITGSKNNSNCCESFAHYCIFLVTVLFKGCKSHSQDINVHNNDTCLCVTCIKWFTCVCCELLVLNVSSELYLWMRK